VIRDTDHVAGIGVVGESAVLREEELRRAQGHRLAAAVVEHLHAAREPAGAEPRKRNTVAMVRIHIGLDLENDRRHAVFVGGDDPLVGLLLARRRRHGADGIEQIADAEIVERAAEEYRAQVTLAERFQIEFLAGLPHQREFLLDCLCGQRRTARRDFGNGHFAEFAGPARVTLDQPHAATGDIDGADEVAAAAHRPVHRRDIERERVLDLVEQLERIAALTVHLVDEGQDRDVAQAAHLEQLSGAWLDTLGGVDHHHGGIDRGQRPVGVLGEVLVAGRIEQIEDAAVIFEGHYRSHDRDSTLALDRHPVGTRRLPVALGLDLPGKLDRAPEQQQLLRQGGLAGVGMRDDGEGPAARDLRRKRRPRLRALLGACRHAHCGAVLASGGPKASILWRQW
jgi:hypothetical protein